MIAETVPGQREAPLMMKAIVVIAGFAVIAFMSSSCGTTTTGSATTTGSGPAAKAPASEAPDETAGQKNARESAESYLDTGAFSRNGLIKQLSSSYGEGYSKAEAIYAVNHVDVNWNEEAVEAAKGYLDTGSFSRNGLIQQLSSSYGDGFTRAQAVYAVNKAYH
jgi:Host cell surface-exposed lipoprotein